MAKNNPCRYFFGITISETLQRCEELGYEPLSLPSIADRRMKGDLSAWSGYSTVSHAVTGIPNGYDDKYVVFVHFKSPFTVPGSIERARKNLKDGAALFDENLFDNLISSLDGHLIIPQRELEELPNGIIRLSQAMRDPRIIAMLDGEERTAEYLEYHSKIYSTNHIGVSHIIDRIHRKPRARLLRIGDRDTKSFSFQNTLESIGEFVGVPREIMLNGNLTFEDIGDMVSPRYLYDLSQLQKPRKHK